ncbi:MAG: efflux RND transporter periplasmic adaptor subunit [Bryobacterales bacterium]|nr:efflux RND transporter periplasmic adaptor subunit [Bryobacterales bacterium]
MNLRRWIVLLVLVILGVIALFSFLRSAPPGVPFGKVVREDLVSTLVTNGQVEPQRTEEIRSEESGKVAALLVRQGDRLQAGQPLLHFDANGAQGQIDDAQATLRSAETRLRQLQAGGPPRARAELDASIRAAQLEQEAARREAEALRRLVDGKAATLEELRRQEAEIARVQARLDGLERQRGATVSPAETAEAESAVELARTALAGARRVAAQRTVRSPIAGTLFELAARLGAWLNPGDLVGRVGDLDAVRLSVFVDEPELGKVQIGLPVTIRWDAQPDRTWIGKVDRLPTRVQAFGTRQVGEVLCLIDNPGRELLPGTNVNVEIQTARVEKALVIPKQALRRRLGADGVWKLAGSSIHWQAIKTGISNLTSAQVEEGLAEGDSVVLTYDRELRDGMEVKPVYP